MKGWRRQALGDALVELLQGSKQFAVAWEGDALKTSDATASR
jgi:hypothetical protein